MDDDLEVIFDADDDDGRRSDAAAAPLETPTAARFVRLTRFRGAARIGRIALVGLLVASAALGGFGIGRSSVDAPRRTPSTVGGVGERSDDGVVRPALGRTAPGYMGWWVDPSTDLRPLFRRTTPAGIELRVYRMPVGESGSTCGPDGWCPPPDCVPTPGVVVEASNDAAVGFGPVLRGAAATTPGFAVVGQGVFGVAEGAPAAWVSAVVPEGTELIRVEAATASDEMVPIAGWATLAVPITSTVSSGTSDDEVAATSAIPDDIVVRGIGPHGEKLGPLPAAELTQLPTPWACFEPGPPLPPSGPQPADVAAASKNVRAAFVATFSGESDRATKLATIDEPLGLEETMAAVAESYPEATRTATVEFGDVVFLAPDRAAVHFLLRYTGAPGLGVRRGHAVHVDGAWKVSRTTVCDLYRDAGFYCARTRPE